MNKALKISPILEIPIIKSGDNLAEIIVSVVKANNLQLVDNDIVCVASKIVSVAEDRFRKTDRIAISDGAKRLHEKVPRKSAQVLQLIFEQAGNDESNIQINGAWIGARSPLGRVLTSAGIDKIDEDTVLLLPEDPDKSAQVIGKAIKQTLGSQVGVIITDSDGREDIAGATQLCVGIFGVPPIRKKNDTEETTCDMLAAAAGLVMGQRDNNIPAVIIHGFQYDFDENAKLRDAY